jgi:hypothetical protein
LPHEKKEHTLERRWINIIRTWECCTATINAKHNNFSASSYIKGPALSLVVLKKKGCNQMSFLRTRLPNHYPAAIPQTQTNYAMLQNAEANCPFWTSSGVCSLHSA